MITYVQGGFFTSPAAVLVNTVNTVGIMGKGIAKEFKAIYPEMFEVYQDACERGDFQIGSLLLYRSEHKSVLNFPTKRHWKQKSQLADIEAGLKAFVEQYDELRISTIAFPQLGCGNGELDWPAIIAALRSIGYGPQRVGADFLGLGPNCRYRSGHKRERQTLLLASAHPDSGLHF